jgi:hypothetical protein
LTGNPCGWWIVVKEPPPTISGNVRILLGGELRAAALFRISQSKYVMKEALNPKYKQLHPHFIISSQLSTINVPPRNFFLSSSFCIT